MSIESAITNNVPSLKGLSASAFVRAAKPENYRPLLSTHDGVERSPAAFPLLQHMDLQLEPEVLKRLHPAISKAIEEDALLPIAKQIETRMREMRMLKMREMRERHEMYRMYGMYLGPNYSAMSDDQLSQIIAREPGHYQARLTRRTDDDITYLIEHGHDNYAVRMARGNDEDLAHLIERNPDDDKARLLRGSEDDLEYLTRKEYVRTQERA